MSWAYTNRTGVAPSVVEAEWVSQPVRFDARDSTVPEPKPQALEQGPTDEEAMAWADIEPGSR
jgi:hypothetical protein